MNYYDLFFIIIFVILIITYLITYFYLNKNSSLDEILETNKVNNDEINEILRNKLPIVITGEIEDWFIFDEKEKIDKNKLNKKILNENSYKLYYPLAITKNINILNENINKKTKILKELNTRHFLGVLTGKISVYLFNPNQSMNFNNNNKISKFNLFNNPTKFKKAKYNEVILNNEKLLYIPYNWWYCYKVIENSKLININSETLFTLPIIKLN